MGHQPLKWSILDYFHYLLKKTHLLVKLDFGEVTTWNWNLQWRRNFFTWEENLLQQLLVAIEQHCPKYNDIDKKMWMNGSTTEYLVNSFVSKCSTHMYRRTLSSRVINFLWQRTAPPRAELTTSFLAQGKLKMGEYLLKLGIKSD